jgi:hypothetical protein
MDPNTHFLMARSASSRVSNHQISSCPHPSRRGRRPLLQQ